MHHVTHHHLLGLQPGNTTPPPPPPTESPKITMSPTEQHHQQHYFAQQSPASSVSPQNNNNLQNSHSHDSHIHSHTQMQPTEQLYTYQPHSHHPKYSTQMLSSFEDQQSTIMSSQRVNTSVVPHAPATAAAPMEDSPLFVNAKQYHRILKRREARQRYEASQRSKREKQAHGYIHESRHKHAMRRPRGPGGRFLTAAERAVLEAQEGL